MHNRREVDRTGMAFKLAIQLTIAQVVVILHGAVGIGLAIAGVRARHAHADRAQVRLGTRITVRIASEIFIARHQFANASRGFADVVPTKLSSTVWQTTTVAGLSAH